MTHIKLEICINGVSIDENLINNIIDGMSLLHIQVGRARVTKSPNRV